MNHTLKIMWYGSLVFMITIMFVDYIGMQEGLESYVYAFALLLFVLTSHFEIIRIIFNIDKMGKEE